MCTLTIAWQVFAGAPVAVAANRDEALGRPAEPPARIEEEDDPVVVAPRDLEAGGTWVGYNEHGLFAGITNRWVEGPAGERSRGLLVCDVLRHSGAEAAARFVEREVEATEYEAFNLVVADADAAFLVEWDGLASVKQFHPGVHVVVNVGADHSFFVPESQPDRGLQQAENARAVREALAPEPGEDVDSWIDRAAGVLRDHDYGVCVHGEGFGTRSSSLIRLGEAGPRYQYADGPPCETPYRPVSDVAGSESQL